MASRSRRKVNGHHNTHLGIRKNFWLKKFFGFEDDGPRQKDVEGNNFNTPNLSQNHAMPTDVCFLFSK